MHFLALLRDRPRHIQGRRLLRAPAHRRHHQRRPACRGLFTAMIASSTPGSLLRHQRLPSCRAAAAPAPAPASAAGLAAVVVRSLASVLLHAAPQNRAGRLHHHGRKCLVPSSYWPNRDPAP